jgi:glucose/arabinose dehydrogenase
MLRFLLQFLVLVVMASAAAGCGATARLTVADGTGPNPMLPAPQRSLLPTVNVVSAKGWTAAEKPVAAQGLTVVAFARGLDHPRWLYVLPNGDVLVAETNAPPRSSGYKGIKGWFFKRYHKKAGGAVPRGMSHRLLKFSGGSGDDYAT